MSVDITTDRLGEKTMNGYAELSPDEAQALMRSEDVYVIDIRDDNSFSTAHI